MKRNVRATLIFVLAAATIQAAMCNVVSPDPKSFFPAIKGNLSKIVWAHAVNSQAELTNALESDAIMMLEADVVMGKLNNSGNTSNPDIPIMAHPPDDESDLSLEDFLHRFISGTNGTKGIKLDFKTIEAFEQSKPIFEKTRNDLTFPVFLNADILPGPVNASDTPVDAKAFLTGAKQVLPQSTLSVGWTTRYGTKFNITEGRYTDAQLQKMVETLKEQNLTQPITYPVRAGPAANDIGAIKKLVDNSSIFKNTTLTIWSSKGDNVDAKQLSKLVKEVGVENVYVDVPEELMKKLDFSGASTVGATLLMSLGPLLVTFLVSRML